MKSWEWRRMLSVMNGYSPKLKIHPASFLYLKLREEQPELDPKKLEDLIVAVWAK